MIRAHLRGRMKKINEWIVLGLAAFSLFPNLVNSHDKQKMQMVTDLEIIKQAFDIYYAPREWKEHYHQWKLDGEFEKGKDQILCSSSLSLQQFQQIVKDFVASTQDYHVKAVFLSTSRATLPFGVKKVEGKYYIHWIDRNKLSTEVYNVNIGDEVLEFDGMSIESAIQKIKMQAGPRGNEETDQSLAELNLTFRLGKFGDEVPKGSCVVKMCSAQGQMRAYQLKWDYRAEQILSPWDILLNQSPLVEWMQNWLSPNLPLGQTLMLSPLSEIGGHQIDGPNQIRGLGAHYSYVPRLGQRIWVSDQTPFYAYIYRNEQKKRIGYIRIPHYQMNEQQDFKAFAEIIQLFESQTDALVIDQLNNPGGYVRTQYALTSMLTNYPLVTPRHRIMITQKDVAIALAMLDILNAVHSNQEAQILFQEVDRQETYQTVLFLRHYYQFIIDEWNAGHLLTDPIHIEGIDYINPHPECNYTKPIVILINELDFSGGDFFPAIMQDNRRAVLFGTRTAGAGGFVMPLSFPNRHGIQCIYYTASIAERMDQKIIESIAVQPDVEYRLTEEDLRQQYRSYKAAVNRVVMELLKNEPINKAPQLEELEEEIKEQL